MPEPMKTPPEPPDVRQRLIQAAYDLLTAQGLPGFKVVEVARRAQANVAMINYHFGSRDGLLDELIRLTGEDVGRERIEGLNALLDASDAAPPTAEAVLRCWLAPLVRLSASPTGQRLLNVMVDQAFAADVSQERRDAAKRDVRQVSARFVDVLQPLFPDADRATIAWSMGCVVGACYQALTDSGQAAWRQLASGLDADDADAPQSPLDRLTAFAVGGLTQVCAPRQAGRARRTPAAGRYRR